MKLLLHEFVRGRIVTTWCSEQDEFLQRIRSRRSANRWAQLLIHETWQLFFALWLHQNKAYHSNPITQNQIQQLSKINQEIRCQWAIGLHGIPHADKHHFTHTKLAQLLKKTLHYKQTWLQAVTHSRKNILPWMNTPLLGATTDLIPKPNATTSCNLMQYFLFCKSNCETNKLITSI